jgi:hypothetical protein
MTTTYDAEPTCDTIAAAYYDDPDTYTIAQAWMSSPLGELDGDIRQEFTRTGTSNERDNGSRAKLFAALAAGIIGGATLGAVLFGYRDVAPPTVVVPGFGVSTAQLPGGSTAPGTAHVPRKPAAAQAPAQKPTDQAAAPNPSAAESKTNEEVAAAPAASPVVVPPVVVDVYVPPLGELPKPQAPAPEPPKPEPPVFDPPNIDVVQIPDESDPNNVVIEAPILDPALEKPTTNELKPVPSSRFTVKLPNKSKDDGPHRQVPSSRFTSIGKS